MQWYSEYIDVKKIIPHHNCNVMVTISKYKNVQYSLFCIKYIEENATFRTKFREKKPKKTNS